MKRKRLKGLVGRIPLTYSVLVTGGRDAPNYWEIAYRLDDVLSEIGIRVLIQGGARGTDTYAREWAKAHDIPSITYSAAWDQEGKGAGIIRNRRMLEALPDVCLAFQGGKGTNDMVRQCTQRGIPVVEVPKGMKTLTGVKELII